MSIWLSNVTSRVRGREEREGKKKKAAFESARRSPFILAFVIFAPLSLVQERNKGERKPTRKKEKKEGRRSLCIMCMTSILFFRE